MFPASLSDLPAPPGVDRLWPPSDAVKRQHLLQIFHARGHDVLVESGTYLGGTVEFFLGRAQRIVSVELDSALAEAAAARFADHPQVEILCEDAAVAIPRVVAGLATPPLVWLDGHFSGSGTAYGDEQEPAVTILDRLAAVHPLAGTSILVDDLRLFGADPAIPSLDALVSGARSAFAAAQIYAEVDALVILT